MRTRLRLFLDWGITFNSTYVLPEQAARTVAYADRQELENSIKERNGINETSASSYPSESRGGGMAGQFQRQSESAEFQNEHGNAYRTGSRGGPQP